MNALRTNLLPWQYNFLDNKLPIWAICWVLRVNYLFFFGTLIAVFLKTAIEMIIAIAERYTWQLIYSGRIISTYIAMRLNAITYFHLTMITHLIPIANCIVLQGIWAQSNVITIDFDLR